jgi:hypothetical protein
VQIHESESEGSADEYKNEEQPESQSEGDVEDEENEATTNLKNKGKKSGRSDISAIRNTDPVSGTPIVGALGGNNKRKVDSEISVDSDIDQYVSNVRVELCTYL